MGIFGLWENAKGNLQFLLVCLIIIAIIFIVSIAAEKYVIKTGHKKRFSTRNIAIIGMFSAIAFILMLFEIPLGFAPTFYKIDFSEVPVLIGSFALGPVAGVVIELCKILLYLFIKGTTTAFVGDFSNFVIGCSFVLPASIIYHVKKSRKTAIIGLVTGGVVMTVFGSAFNAIYLLPKFAELYGMPLDTIIAMGTAVNSHINSVTTMVLFAVVPFNLLKSILVSIITLILYKRISPLLKRST